MNELMNNPNRNHGTLSEFDHFLQNMFAPFSDFAPEMMGAAAFPKMEIETTDKEVVAKLPLPGYKNSEIDVEVVGNLLTVHAKHECECGKEGRFLRKERSCAEYEETVRLPGSVKGSEAAAKYKDGILMVTIPLDPAHAVQHTIKVK